MEIKDINNNIDLATNAFEEYEKAMDELLGNLTELYCFDSSEEFIDYISDDEINWNDSAKYECLDMAIMYQDILISELKKIRDGSDISLGGIRADVNKFVVEWETSVADIEANIQKMKSILSICDEVEGITH